VGAGMAIGDTERRRRVQREAVFKREEIYMMS
jgi:hypothetical protein